MSGPTRMDGDENSAPRIDYTRRAPRKPAQPPTEPIDYTKPNDVGSRGSGATRLDGGPAAPPRGATRMDGGPAAPPAGATRMDGAPGTHSPASPLGPGSTRLDGATGSPPGQPRPASTWSPLPAEISGFFTIQRELGAGGEATVYLCRDDVGYIARDRRFAVKVYRSTPKFAIEFGTPKFNQQFPAQYAVVLHRRGHDLTENRFYDVLEFCEEGTLEDVLGKWPGQHARSNSEALHILAQIAEALNGIQQPHSPSPLVHGDLKPENILVRSTSPLDLVLTDFGLAVELTNRSRATNTGRGTYAYSAPGALQSSTLYADWWSVGMIAFRVLVGRGYFTLPDGSLFNDDRILEELATQDIGFEAIDGLQYLTPPERERWKLLLTGLLTRRPNDRWGYEQVSEWLRGESPEVAASALRATGRETGRVRTTATRPFVLPGEPEFHTVADMAEWLAAHPDRVARRFTGARPDQLIKWMQAEFGTETWTFSAYNSSWNPRAKAAYLTSQIAPSASVAYEGYRLDSRGDLLTLAQAAEGNEVAAKTLKELHDLHVIGALESEDRPGFARLDADWHATVESVEAICTRDRHSLSNDQRATLYGQALAAACGAEAEVAQQITRYLQSMPTAMSIDWFRELSQRHGQEPFAGLVAAGLLVGKAQVQANDAEAERQREMQRREEQERAERERLRQQAIETQRRIDTRIVTWTIRALIAGAVATVIIAAIKVNKPDTELGRLTLEVFWITASVLLGIVLIAALATLRPPWANRVPRVIGAACVAAVMIAGMTYTIGRAGYQSVMTQAFDFGGQYYQCGDSVQIPIRDGDSETEVWQMYRGRVKGSDISGCNRISLYRDKEVMSKFDLAGGDYFLPETAPDGGAAMFASFNGTPLENSDVVEGDLFELQFFARTNDGRLISVSPASPSSYAG